MRWFAFLLSLLLMAGCDSTGPQETFEDDASRPPSGFTRTDANGGVLSVDEDDWRTAPAFAGIVRVSPAHPNPPGDQFVNIPVSVFQFNQVRGGLVVRALDAADRFIVLDEIQQASSPGAYVFTFSPSLIGRRGLVRLFILDGFEKLVSYGDLMIE
ncbi:hypothetical protein AWN76_006665 [Rhodothermaceae bacterium RA]|nr:hypothetical protein AWN76_006665 [Rhodothermaceae bacterium RA]